MPREVDASATRAALARLVVNLESAAWGAIQAGLDAAARSAADTHQYNDRTGRTRESVAVVGHRLRGGGATLFLENGTAPHVIRPRGNNLLVFVVNGHTVMARSVNHPGTKARPFMTDARNLGELAAYAAAVTYVSEAIHRAG